eukprot:TRINITY_DN3453_c0_g6_i1.p1 TRINITY_DN3453_c0_g6~~TRINITY_DN3453_c0_g6_i1.p1  ORF type:complete len:401 (+),score=46.54 TRINITY_DN3453_c0_g6_i1:48-1205(+)
MEGVLTSTRNSLGFRAPCCFGRLRKSVRFVYSNKLSYRSDKFNRSRKVGKCQAQVVPTFGAPVVNEEKLRSWFNGFNVDFEQTSCLKVAITGRKVGMLLGQGGQRCQSLQEEHSVRIIVTSNGDTIPGTRQRLVQIHGVLGNCMLVLSEILEDIVDDAVGEFGEPISEQKKLGVVFPIEVVGKIFGEGGSMLRNLMNVTGATISAQLQEHMWHMQDVRKFELVGTPEQLLQAYMGLLALCVAEPKYAEFSEVLPTTHTDSEWLPRFLQTMPRNQILMGANYTIQIGVPQSFVPRILGKQASNLIRLLQASGNCQIDIPRDEFVEGTDLRKVILQGNFKDVMKAQAGLDKMIRDSIRGGILDPAEFARSRRYTNNNRRSNQTRRES